MMQNEFEQRANFKVSTDCYHKLIEPEYNASKLDKDEWVKEWKKQGGIQKAYEWELDLGETAQAIQDCIDTYTEEREKRKEAGTWELPRR
jgi:hypothetical protein